jgi:hypothetical protein
MVLLRSLALGTETLQGPPAEKPPVRVTLAMLTAPGKPGAGTISLRKWPASRMAAVPALVRCS